MYRTQLETQRVRIPWTWIKGLPSVGSFLTPMDAADYDLLQLGAGTAACQLGVPLKVVDIVYHTEEDMANARQDAEHFKGYYV